MTHIRFLHNASERLAAAHQWLRRAWESRTHVLVYAPDAPIADKLDRMLWTQPPLSFIPHCTLDAPLAAETPILICHQLDHTPHDGCLLNLSNGLPPGFSRFAEVVEIVSIDDSDRLPARERFKFYRERGYPLDSRDISNSLAT